MERLVLLSIKEIEQSSFHSAHALEVLDCACVNIDAAEATKMRL
jgi:hypothetical protein